MYSSAYVWAKVLSHMEEQLGAIVITSAFDDAEAAHIGVFHADALLLDFSAVIGGRRYEGHHGKYKAYGQEYGKTFSFHNKNPFCAWIMESWIPFSFRYYIISSIILKLQI